MLLESYDDDNFDSEVDIEEEQTDIKDDFDTLNDICYELKNYTEKNALCMCENINVNNIIDFIHFASY